MISALLLSSVLGANPDLVSSLREVRSTFLEDGADRVSATPTHRVVSHADGSLELQGVQPLRLSLESVRRERGARCLTRSLTREVDPASPRTVRTARACDLEETWTNGADGLAHAFTLQRPPEGRGGLTLRVAVEGPWHHQDGEGHVFKGPGAADLLRYGNAFVIREGHRFPIPVVRVEGGLELRVPRSLVEAAGAFPMHIDPVLSSEVPLDGDPGFGPPPSQEETPAIAVNASGVAMVVWVDRRRQLGTDIFGARFNTSGSLADQFGIPISQGVGHQLRPTICGQGNSFLIAWDTFSPGPDAGLEVHAREFTASGTLTPETFVVQGSQPALAAAGDGGYSVLAWVDTDATVQVVPMSGTVKGTRFVRPANTATEIATRPAIAASDRSWFVAWESESAGSANTGIRGMASGSSTPVLLDISPAANPVASRRPTVALSTDGVGDTAHVYWEQGPTQIAGATFSGMGTMFSSPSAGSSPAAVRTSTAQGVLPTIGYFSAGALHLRNLNDNSDTTLLAGARPNDLVLAAGPKLYAAWTEGLPPASDVMGASFTLAGTNPQQQPMSRAANAQLIPHVAMKDDGTEGLAVWVEGASLILAAKVVAGPNGLTFGSPFQLANPIQAIEQLDVAASGNGPLYLVAWRQSGSSITGQLTTGSSRDGTPIPLGILAPGAGPAVAWDEGRSLFMVAWSQVQGLGFDVVTRTVSPAGLPAPLVTHASGAASDVDLTCFRSQCLLAWQRNDPRDVQALLLGTLAPLHTQPQASQPSVTHDGVNFFLGWRAGNGLSFAKVDFGTGAVTPLNGVTTPNGGVITQHSLASASPPIVAWSEVTPNEEQSVYLQRLDFVEQASRFNGVTAHVTTMGVKPQGVVVYQRYESADGFHVMRSFGTLFAWPFDAGVPDAGVSPDAGVDAGTPDAGPAGDAGVTPSDGGVDAGEPAPPDAGLMSFGTSGCSCDASSSAPLLLLALLAAARRRSRG
ncbi:MAG: hypothetical protein Q8L48_29340 [Archangium sp.]|nr:hypothetical protein [Archangium sp.]